MVSANFGSQRNKTNGYTLIYDGTKVGDATNYDVISLSPGGMYILYTASWTTSTGAVYGSSINRVTAPLEDKFGSVAVGHGNVYATSTTGVSFSWATDSTIKWRCANENITAQLKVYKL